MAVAICADGEISITSFDGTGVTPVVKGHTCPYTKGSSIYA
jgi:hypothetical protein